MRAKNRKKNIDTDVRCDVSSRRVIVYIIIHSNEHNFRDNTVSALIVLFGSIFYKFKEDLHNVYIVGKFSKSFLLYVWKVPRYK